MGASADAARSPASSPGWVRSLSDYERPSTRRAAWQILDTFGPYVALWVAMVVLVQGGYPYWMTLVLAVPAAGLLVRIFIIFHDCGHGSFLASRRGNKVIGYLSGILTFTPFDQWSHAHAIHHATSGDLDRRGVGDVWTLTVDEYLALSRRKRLGYRLYRNPFILLGLGPILLFLVMQRMRQAGFGKREHTSVIVTNLAIVGLVVAAVMILGLRTYLLVQLPVIIMASVAGTWLFYVQHQFEGTYWARHREWDPIRAALEGSSYYKLSGVLQWFTGSIGLHHIHHLRPRIPNYRLQECFDHVPPVQAVTPLTLRSSMRSLGLRLWDERRRRLVGFRDVPAAGRS